MSASTESKVVLVTGCTKGGIGFALCEEFASAGCKVYATARRAEAMDGFSHENIEKIALDVTDEEARKKAINRILRESGRIDILVNNAGVICAGPILDVDIDTARNAFETNFFAPMRLAQLVIPHMAEQGHGVVVNIGSVAGNVPTPWNGTYCASKSALHAMNEALAMECGFLNKNIKVVLVAPSDSLFKQYTQAIHKRIVASQGGNAMTGEEFSQHLVSQVLSLNPPDYVTLGGFHKVFAAAQWLPRSLVRWAMWKVWGQPNQ